jgi:hypothetical protein
MLIIVDHPFRILYIAKINLTVDQSENRCIDFGSTLFAAAA